MDSSPIRGTKRKMVDLEVEVDEKKRRSSLDNMEYEVWGFKRSFHGVMYQVKLLLLFLVRAEVRKMDFRLATEWKAAEKFDDVVFQFQDEHNKNIGRFLQAKHKQDENEKITFKKLLNEKEGDFSLKKYFISYVKMKQNFSLKDVKMKDFVIFTNIDFHAKCTKLKDILKKIATADSMLDVHFEGLNKTPTRYSLIPNEEIKEILRKSFDKELAGHALSNSSEELLDEFFSRLVFAVDQVNEVQLGRVIEQEVSLAFNLFKGKDIFDQLQSDLIDWFKKKNGTFLTEKTGNAFLKHAKRMFSSRVAIGLSVKYKAEVKAHSADVKFNEFSR